MKRLMFVGLFLLLPQLGHSQQNELLEQLMRNNQERINNNHSALESTLEDIRIRERMRLQAQLNEPSVADRLNESMRPRYEIQQPRQPVICNHIGNMTFCN